MVLPSQPILGLIDGMEVLQLLASGRKADVGCRNLKRIEHRKNKS
jgi:hypothetical protein